MYRATATIAAATALMLSLSTGANAAAKIRDLRIEQNTSGDLPVIRVESTNNKTYNQVRRQTTPFAVNISGRIKNWRGGFKFYHAWVRLMGNDEPTAGKPVPGPRHTFLRDHCIRGIFRGRAIGCPPSIVGGANRSLAANNRILNIPHRALGSVRDKAINACNTLLGENAFEPEAGHTFDMPMVMRLHAKAGRPKNGIPLVTWPYSFFIGAWTGRADNTVKNDMMVEVRCQPILPPRAAPKLQIASVQVHVKGDSQSCPKPHQLKVVFRAYSEKTIKFRVRKNGQLSELFTRSLEKNGSHYEYRFVKDYHLDPGNTDFRIEVRDGPKSDVITKSVTCPPFKVISTFLNYAHEDKSYCPKTVRETTTFKTTRPGWIDYEIRHESGLVFAQGKVTSTRNGNAYTASVVRDLPFNESYEGLFMAVATGPFGGNSSWTPLKVDCMKMVSSKLTVSDPKNNGNVCKRPGAVNAVMVFNQPGKINYRINCSNGFSKTQSAAVAKNPLSGDFRATAYHEFDVSKSDNVACFLQDVDNNYALLASASHAFACKSRIDVKDGTGGFEVEAVPPARIVTPRKPERRIRKDRLKDKADARKAKEDAAAERRARAKAQAEARRKAKAKAEARRKAKAKAEARRKAKAKAEARRKAKAKAEARRKAKAKAEARRKAKAKAEARRKAKAKAEARRKAKAKAEARRKAKAKAEARRKAKARAKAKRKAKAAAARRVGLRAKRRN